MNDLQEVCDIFATLHDGSIDHYARTPGELEIKVGCSYLAKYISPEFDSFYIKLFEVEEFYFEEYGYPTESYKKLINDFTELVAAEIELLYADIVDGRVKVDCTEGSLYIKCKSIELSDQQKRPITSSDLFKISKLYWSGK
jgi:hypothetical protein